jgi:hypothetical protein
MSKKSGLLDLEAEGTSILRNVDKSSFVDTALHRWKLEYSLQICVGNQHSSFLKLFCNQRYIYIHIYVYDFLEGLNPEFVYNVYV